MGRAEISRRSGLCPSAIVRLLRGDQRTLATKLYASLAAVRPVAAADQPSGEVDATGTRRRIQALVALGWSNSKIAKAAGIAECNIARLLTPGERCFSETRRRVAAAYDELWDKTPPPNPGHSDVFSRKRAAANGWAKPMAWDDGHGPHGIDNPNATPYTDPEQGAVETMADKARWLFEGGLRLPTILERLDTTRPTLYAAIHRTEPDLWERLTREEAA
jgi:hypothetical protein